MNRWSVVNDPRRREEWRNNHLCRIFSRLNQSKEEGKWFKFSVNFLIEKVYVFKINKVNYWLPNDPRKREEWRNNQLCRIFSCLNQSKWFKFSVNFLIAKKSGFEINEIDYWTVNYSIGDPPNRKWSKKARGMTRKTVQ